MSPLPTEPEGSAEAKAKLAAIAEQVAAREARVTRMIGAECRRVTDGSSTPAASAQKLLAELSEAAAIIEHSLAEVRALGMDEPQLALRTYRVLRRALGTVRMAMVYPDATLQGRDIA